MNGMDNILRRIREDAQREMDAMEREALEKQQAILAQGRAQAEAILEEGRQSNRAAADSRKARLVSAANMEARQVLLQTKQKYIEESFVLARHRVSALPWEEYADYLARWVANAAETGREEVILSERNREKMGQRILDKANALREGAAFTLSPETREMNGVVLRQGNIEINGDLDHRFRLLRERLATEVADLLFC